MAARGDVTPNRRGMRPRDAVLDTAERLMAKHGHEAATVAAIVEESGIPLSSVYHYYGSKDGILLAVMERGARRFFDSLPEVDERVGGPEDHLRALAQITRAALEEHPDFLRLLVGFATQPPGDDYATVRAVVNRVRDEALSRIKDQIGLAFAIRADAKLTQSLARFTLAVVDGAFVATQADAAVRLDGFADQLPTALIALHAAARSPAS